VGLGSAGKVFHAAYIIVCCSLLIQFEKEQERRKERPRNIQRGDGAKRMRMRASGGERRNLRSSPLALSPIEEKLEGEASRFNQIYYFSLKVSWFQRGWRRLKRV
jgi:hypothetical protein